MPNRILFIHTNQPLTNRREGGGRGYQVQWWPWELGGHMGPSGEPAAIRMQSLGTGRQAPAGLK